MRVELQRPNGRRSERLALEDQDRVASALGLAGRGSPWPVSSPVGRGGAIEWPGWWRTPGGARPESVDYGREPPRQGPARPTEVLGPGVVLRDNEVAVPLATAVGEDPTLALRVATASAELGLPLSRPTMERLAQEAPEPASPWTEEVKRAFLRLLSAGPGSTHAVEMLDHLGVWARYVPEWANGSRNRPQFNPYHRWSVDRHLLETTANATEHMLDVRRPDLLLLGAIMHDIGKGTGDDHSESGADIAASFVGERVGLSTDDAASVQILVRHHLLLPEVATRRDIEDPATVALVAETVENVTTLELLNALASADGRATGPAAWTEWKAGQLSTTSWSSG